jgi:phosphoribosylaminoimidazole-succinocarboxamide synthase
VRDTFAIPDDKKHLLVVATDRVSTHNVTHLAAIPKKGHVLTAMTVFWMANKLRGVQTHLVAYGKDIFNYLPPGDYPEDLAFRAIIVRKLTMINVEFIFRSYLAGSLYKDIYLKGKPDPYFLNLPKGLRLMSSFGKDVFTPTDKSETDNPLDGNQVVLAHWAACELARAVYKVGRAHARTCGIEIIDGKFEIGYDETPTKPILADECLTPDSCRFVGVNDVKEGVEPMWLDKQYLREKAEAIWAGGPKVPLAFDEEVISQTTERYEKIFEALTGVSLSEYQSNHLT